MRSLLALAAVLAGCGFARAQDGPPAPYTLQQAYADQLNRNTADIAQIKAAQQEQAAVNAAILAKLDAVSRDLSALKATPPPAAKDAAPVKAANPNCQCSPGSSCGCKGAGDCARCAAGVQLWRPAGSPPGTPYVTEAEYRRLHPGARFPHDPVASGVATTAPFVQGSGCSAAGCSTGPGTRAPLAGTTSAGLTPNSAPAPYQIRTSTGAGSAVQGGGTSGCASGNCAAPVQARGFRR